MPDPIAAGTQGNGHGRGMGQWPSEWWASGSNSLTGAQTQPATWQCILDHYYNDNGGSTGNEIGNRTSFLNETGFPGYGPSPDGAIAYAPLPPPQPSMPRMRNTGRVGPADACSPTVSTDLYTMLLDGTGLLDITPYQCNNSPAWAPTQKQIAYTQWDPNNGWEVTIMNSGSAGGRELAPGYGPNWSLQNVIAYGTGYFGPGLYSLNPSGSNLFQIDPDASAGSPSWSPDGGQIAYDVCYPVPLPICSTVEIALINANGSGRNLLTSAPANNWSPSWSPDGTKIVYLSDASGTREVWVMNSDGTLPTELTFLSPNANMSPQWSQDGRYIIWLTSQWGPQQSTITLNIMNSDGTNPYSYGQNLPTATGSGGASINTTRCRRFDSL